MRENTTLTLTNNYILSSCVKKWLTGAGTATTSNRTKQDEIPSANHFLTILWKLLSAISRCILMHLGMHAEADASIHSLLCRAGYL